jgi:hypothetical protein
MNSINKFWKIAVDEARGFLLDVFNPLISMVRRLCRRNKK